MVVLEAAAVVGFCTGVAAAAAYLHRQVPRAYPRERTRLDERTYRVVRAGLAVGLPVGAGGGVLSLVDTLGSVQAANGADGLLPGLALLVPAWAGTWLVRVGVALLVAAALLAGIAEARATLSGDGPEG